MRQLIDKIAEALLKPVNEIVTYMLGVYTVVWGIWVLVPFFDVFTRAPLYSALLSFIPFEWVWGLIAVFFGILTILGTMKHMPRTMFYGAGASGVHWFVISIFYFIGDWGNTGGITALFLAILSLYIYLNCKIRYDREHPRPTFNHSKSL